MKTELAANELSRYDVDSMLYALRNLGEVYDELDFNEQRQLVRSVLSSVAVDKHEVTYNVFALPGLILDSANTGTQVVGEAQSPSVCEQVRIWQMQGAAGWPAPYAFVLAWSLAPLIAAVGIRALPPPASFVAAAAAFLASLTSVVSFGGFAFFLPSVLVSGFVVGSMAYAASSGRDRPGVPIVSGVALASLGLAGLLFLLHSLFYVPPLIGGALFALFALDIALRQR